MNAGQAAQFACMVRGELRDVVTEKPPGFLLSAGPLPVPFPLLGTLLTSSELSRSPPPGSPPCWLGQVFLHLISWVPPTSALTNASLSSSVPQLHPGRTGLGSVYPCLLLRSSEQGRPFCCRELGFNSDCPGHRVSWVSSGPPGSPSFPM